MKMTPERANWAIVSYMYTRSMANLMQKMHTNDIVSVIGNLLRR